PVRAVAGPAVDEDEGRVPTLVRLEVDRDPVRRGGDVLHGGGRGGPAGTTDALVRRVHCPAWPRSLGTSSWRRSPLPSPCASPARGGRCGATRRSSWRTSPVAWSA